ncbi:MAG: NAD(P)-dependent alcohol dehydrogenase [Candidatus Nanopelagicales bacterium]
MRAVVYERYGSSDVLEVREVPTPAPTDDQVLVRVHASSINAWDWDAMRGVPYLTRLGTGLRAPRVRILGGDVAGVVEAAGPSVRDIGVGDEVFGDLAGGSGFGGFAEYVAAPARALAPKSPDLTFQQAAAIPQAGLLALQGLRRNGPVSPGHRVLINGGGGGAGTFAIQIAKAFGAEVTAVDAAHKLDTMRAVGADHVVDFEAEDYTVTKQRFDLILDLAAHRSVRHPRRVLKPSGRYVVVGGATGVILQTVAYGGWTAIPRRRRVGLLLYRLTREDLVAMNELVEAGRVTPLIDRVYPLERAPQAMRYFGDGKALGKVVVSVRAGY